MTIGKTERGFYRMEFKDRNSVDCSLQQSSLALEDCIWLGCNDIGLKRFTPGGFGWEEIPLANEGPHGVAHIANTRMHLNRAQVAAMLPHLQRFVKTGGL